MYRINGQCARNNHLGYTQDNNLTNPKPKPNSNPNPLTLTLTLTPNPNRNSRNVV